MTNKTVSSHELARLLLAGPDVPVMVNGDHNAAEKEELTSETISLESIENGDYPGGVLDAPKWIALGR